jgi:hypothetical protein
LVLGIVSLVLDWVLVTGTVNTINATHNVDISLYPFRSGLVSITEGLQYMGREMPSMINQRLQSILGSSGPVWTMFLIPIGCVVALSVFYKPKNTRQRRLKAAFLMISGILIIASVVQTFMFVQGQASTINGAATSYGTGIYLAILSGVLVALSGIFTIRENHNNTFKTKTYQEVV